jgi:hypothetical protein
MADPGAASATIPEMAAAIDSADIAEIRALFLRQAAGETAHDIEAIDAVLAHAPPGQPDPVNFVARAYCFWGREAVLNHFRTIFAGTWRFEPDESAIRVVQLGPDVAHIYAPEAMCAPSWKKSAKRSANGPASPPKRGVLDQTLRLGVARV